MINTVFGMTDIGMKRDRNEDAFLLLPDKQLLIVSDGMGGHNAGELASNTAVKALELFFSKLLMPTLPENLVQEIMINAVLDANKMVYEKGLSEYRYSGMGCTLALAYINHNILHICNVGDSRVYLISKDTIQQLTTDQSVVMELVKKGLMSQEEARRSQLKNQLTQALGIKPTVIPEYLKHQVKKNDRVLLCTDGLWDKLIDNEIKKAVYTSRKLEMVCSRLIKLANNAGGDDNITVVVAKVTGS